MFLAKMQKNILSMAAIIVLGLGVNGCSGSTGSVGDSYIDIYERNISVAENTDVTVYLDGDGNYTIYKYPAHGTLEDGDDIFIYTPNENYSGKDEFRLEKNTAQDEDYAIYVYYVDVI